MADPFNTDQKSSLIWVYTGSVWSDLVSIQIFMVKQSHTIYTESQVTHQKLLTEDHIINSQNAVIGQRSLVRVCSR